jgi:hypothetical protein
MTAVTPGREAIDAQRKQVLTAHTQARDLGIDLTLDRGENTRLAVHVDGVQPVSADTLVLDSRAGLRVQAEVIDETGTRRTIPLPTRNGQDFEARGASFPTEGGWTLELTLVQESGETLLQPYAVPEA